MLKKFHLICCHSKTGGIGIINNGKPMLPWHLPDDLHRFKRITKGKTILMGRNTWDSLPKKPLPGRKNIVLTSNPINLSKKYPRSVVFSQNIDWCFDHLAKENGFVIGGQSLYEKAIKDPRLDELHLTEIQKSIRCDSFFPIDSVYNSNEFVLGWQSPIEYYRGIPYQFKILTRNNVAEQAYIDLLIDVMAHGIKKKDRTNTGIKSIFAPPKLEFDLRYNQFPLLTTKKVFFKGIAEELFWFLRGSVDTTELQERGIHFWDSNSSHEFLHQHHLEHFGENTIGKGYGHQLRHWNGKYDISTKTSSAGIDQVQRLIDTIINDPTSRRLILNVWNVGDLDQMALAPCHLVPVQFWVNTQELSCQWYQRSADLFLGLPFNIASYALLTKLIAKDTGLNPGKLTVCLGDAHVYLNHLDQIKEQIGRPIKRFPELEFKESAKNKSLELSDMKSKNGYNYKDFEIIGYNPCSVIKAKMAV